VSDATEVAYIDIHEIQNLIPHRYPFLMIDAHRGPVWKFHGDAKVNDKVVTEAALSVLIASFEAMLRLDAMWSFAGM